MHVHKILYWITNFLFIRSECFSKVVVFTRRRPTYAIVCTRRQNNPSFSILYYTTCPRGHPAARRFESKNRKFQKSVSSVRPSVLMICKYFIHMNISSRKFPRRGEKTNWNLQANETAACTARAPFLIYNKPITIAWIILSWCIIVRKLFRKFEAGLYVNIFQKEWFMNNTRNCI